MENTAKLDEEKLKNYFYDVGLKKISSIAIATEKLHPTNMSPTDVTAEGSDFRVVAVVDFANADGTCEIEIMTNASMLELPENCEALFADMPRLESFDVSSANIDASKVKNISHMFEGDKNLRHAILDGWQFGNVKDACYMFSRCESLEEVNIGEGYEKLENVRSAFEYCKSIKELNVAPFFESDNLWRSSYLCYKCQSLEHVDMGRVSYEDLDKDMFQPFGGDYNLKTVRIEEGVFEPIREVNNDRLIGFSEVDTGREEIRDEGIGL